MCTKFNKLCAWRHNICLRALQVDNIFAFIRQMAPVSACWLYKTSVISWPLTFCLENGVRVTCDVGYLCANFSIPSSLCSQVRTDVRDRRHTSDITQKVRLMPPPYGGGVVIILASVSFEFHTKDKFQTDKWASLLVSDPIGYIFAKVKVYNIKLFYW